ncbi:hypothetical protein EJB05_54808, partial [Eragrostis curvula]
MDSGNSGSLQSSSGGDDDYDSRGRGGGGGGGVDSSPLSALLRPAPSHSASPFSLHGSLYGLQEFASPAPPQQQQQQAGSSNPTAGAGDAFQLTSSALLRMHQDPSSYLSFQNLLDSQSVFGAAGGFAQAPRMHEPSPSEFLASVGGGGSLGLTHGGGLMGSEGMHLHSRSDVQHHGHGGDELSGLVAGGASGGSCKLNYSTHAGASASSSAAASGDKPPEGGGGGRPARSEGLDPWICTSE